MAGLNVIQLIGNVGMLPKIKHTPSGKVVATFTLGVNRTWKDDSGEKQESVEWFNAEAWGNLASVIEKYVTKGRLLYLQGRLQTRKFIREDGTDGYWTSVVIGQMQFLDPKPSGVDDQPDEILDEIPF